MQGQDGHARTRQGQDRVLPGAFENVDAIALVGQGRALPRYPGQDLFRLHSDLLLCAGSVDNKETDRRMALILSGIDADRAKSALNGDEIFLKMREKLH